MWQRIYIHLAVYNNFYLFIVGFLFWLGINISIHFIFDEDFDIKTMQEQGDHYNIEYENRLDTLDINNTTKPTGLEEWDYCDIGYGVVDLDNYNTEYEVMDLDNYNIESQNRMDILVNIIENKNRMESTASIISIERPPVPYTDDFSLVHEGTVQREIEKQEITPEVTIQVTPAEFTASNINENKEQLLKEKELYDSLKEKYPQIDFSAIKKKKHVTWAPDVKDNEKPNNYHPLVKEYQKVLPPLPNKTFVPSQHLDVLTGNVLLRLTDLHANDNDVELIKNTTFKTLQDDPLYSEWKVNSERDMRNSEHPSNQMVSICREICIFCSQSGDREKQNIGNIVAHIGTCIVVLNSMNYLGQDPSHYLNSELYDTTFNSFFKSHL